MLSAKKISQTSPLITSDSQDGISNIKGDNPLIWPVFSLLQNSNHSWKVHLLATELQQKGLMQDLDEDQDKALFKRNFLLMNALFQLQSILLPEHWLQVKAMEIQVFKIIPTNLESSLREDDALREYYLNWINYDTCPNIIKEMLESFWSRYEDYIGTNPNLMHKDKALKVFDLNLDATDREVRRRWRKLALKWHPDRPDGNAAQFRQVCEAWQTLRVK
ncbi:molecular chaperone DnaJ [Shewanella hanedai]|jgi:DnaJ-domain-containing protein 1|uniref:Molecular chaperone DnaJ n=1 Tax=Shewanella hanedai TaxID=25 RepID=A0A553JV75_SHEHA|nr:DNA-J related domain-containing protein [Shewanella hanedai]TRY16346.1 molecular chaperone DnaJ [Shewanella hanedai]GGI68267.1 molecular chaperone DnaJ [Shewanella hanedai]